MPVKVKVLHGFVKLLFYALPTGNLLHYTSGRNDVLRVSVQSHEFFTVKELPACIVFPRNSIPFPGAFPASVIMAIARLFTGQAHYCVLCYGRPSWMSFKST